MSISMSNCNAQGALVQEITHVHYLGELEKTKEILEDLAL